MIWEAPISDVSGLAGCSGYDVDGDGAYEVLYADEDAFRLYDGATGSVHYENTDHSSGTLWEYPVVADVDRDGSAEIVVAHNLGSYNGFTVYGHSGSGWQASGPAWAIHDFAVTNIEPDGTVPTPAPMPWTTHNVFRARPMLDEIGQADLYAWVEDVCVPYCDHGLVKLSFAVANQGAVDVPAGISVALYAVDAGAQTLLGTAFIDRVETGEVISGGIFELQQSDWGPDGVLLVVDDDGTGAGLIEECDESNNEDLYLESLCE